MLRDKWPYVKKTDSFPGFLMGVLDFMAAGAVSSLFLFDRTVRRELIFLFAFSIPSEFTLIHG